MRYPLLIAFIISLNSFLKAQDCTGYHKYHCPYGDYSFYTSQQSTSALFRRGQTSEFNMVIYGDEDYYIAVCGHRKLGDLHFRLLEDNKERNVLYDNAQDDFSESIVFTNEVTRNIIVEVTVPESGSGKDKDLRCVGIVVQFRETGETEPKF